MIGKDKLVFCQPADEAKITAEGFTDVRPVQDEMAWEGIRISRTGGRHGTGEVGERMGTVSGFVLQHGKDKIYIAGDSIWCEEVKRAIGKHQPEHIIVNGGGAQFLQGDPITMTVEDVMALCRFTTAKVHVVHLETINHCYQRRPDFKAAIENNGFSGRAFVPDDGSWLMIG
jgi:L-ascorbate metabolism protein UlaG (beta-lactamase superfamily)